MSSLAAVKFRNAAGRFARMRMLRACKVLRGSIPHYWRMAPLFIGLTVTTCLVLIVRLIHMLRPLWLTKLTCHGVKAEITVLKCLSPGRPGPTYRYGRIV